MTDRLTIPQTVTPHAPYGSLLKSAPRRPSVSASLTRGRTTDAGHLALIRQLPCLKCGLDPCGEAAHVRMNSAAFGKRQALGPKPGDEWTVPLCRACHQSDPDAQHRVGELAFWSAIGINPLIVARDLYRVTGDALAMRAVTLVAIAGRSTSHG